VNRASCSDFHQRAPRRDGGNCNRRHLERTFRILVAPGRTNDAIVCLADGQKVTVLEGPQPADNLQWWKVKTNLGDGWAAEDYLTPEPQP